MTDRFWSKVAIRGGDDCWVWVAATKSNGYGAFRHRGKTIGAHRMAYELAVGPIPDGMVIDHLCRNRACQNPDHMEVVTQGENIRRGDLPRILRERAEARTECFRGHPWPEHKRYTRGKVVRAYCAECRREDARKAYWAKRGAA